MILTEYDRVLSTSNSEVFKTFGRQFVSVINFFLIDLNVNSL